MNLVVNARDAMPGGGTVVVETANVLLDAEYCAPRDALEPGPYVLLSVKDTGCGMTPDVLTRVFEPFFTTKPLGKGTGLGLSTVYGIVKQNDGFITVDSTPGEGTTFKVFLPATATPVPTVEAVSASARARGGSETVLLCEDEASVRILARRMLELGGYTVLTAENGPHAIEIADAYEGPIHLLITDVIMPGMNGQQLAQELHARRPETSVLYVSGYSLDVIAHHGVVDDNIKLIEKPFSLRRLLDGVQTALEAQRQ